MRKPLLTACLGLFACANHDTSSTPPGGDHVVGPQTSPEKTALVSQLQPLDSLTPDDLLARAKDAPAAPLGYDPGSAGWLDLIQKSTLALNDTELAAYQKNGFVISTRQAFPHFFDGYKAIYAMDLPLFVSADSVLFALHKSFDAVLKNIEESYLTNEVAVLLAAARRNLPTAAIGADAKLDLECLLGVAAALLTPGDTSTHPDVAGLVQKANAQSGTATVSLFGSKRMIDFSQFKPRGHYDDGGGILSRYFRAMMWLGRTEYRLVDVDVTGKRTLNRRETEDTLAMAEVVAGDLRTRWENIDKILTFFVGEADYMPLPQVDALKTALGIAASTGLSGVSDADLLRTIDAGNYGVQRIASQLMETDAGMTTLPNSFALLGQRYTVDSHVFSQVVYPSTSTRRMMPNPLDVAYAALGNDQAAHLLKNDLVAGEYAPQLAKARQLVDWHGGDFWITGLYSSWLGALRELSPGAQDMATLPAIARTEAWGRRILNTQLASWAELRHDTLLYAKQSYTGMPLCEYPDGYVDPYPGVFKRLKDMGDTAANTLGSLLPNGTQAITYFQQLATIAGRLEGMARQELAGATRTQEDLDFLNEAVTTKTISAGCVTVTTPTGWYTKLFYNRDDITKYAPTVADVHTQPTDEGGNPVGKVLHVATGNPRLMVLSTDSCAGPRAYVGVVSAYHEQITNDFKRLTDQEWLPTATTAPDVPWMQDVVAR